MTLNALYNHSQSAWNRNDGRGFWLSVLGPLVAVLIINASMALFGWNEADPAYDAVPFNPPGWLVGFVWLIIYPMWARRALVCATNRSCGPAHIALGCCADGLWPCLPVRCPTVRHDLQRLGECRRAGARDRHHVAAATRLQTRRRARRAIHLWLAFATVLGFAALSYV